jgi:hypothetical protein
VWFFLLLAQLRKINEEAKMNSAHPSLRITQILSAVVIASFFLTWDKSWSGSSTGLSSLLSVLKSFDGVSSLIPFLLVSSPIICHIVSLSISNNADKKKLLVIWISIPVTIWFLFYSFIGIKSGSLFMVEMMLPQKFGAISTMVACAGALVSSIVFLNTPQK